MLQNHDSQNNLPPTNEALVRRGLLMSLRIQMLVGIIPGDSRSGFSIVGVCAGCGKLLGFDITLASGRGDELRTACEHCDEPWSHQLDSEYPLAPLGSDAAPPASGRRSR